MISKKIPKNKIATIWLSSITASGKTTLGKLLYSRLKFFGIENIKFFDGEDLRELLVKKYGHSLNERFKVLKEYIKIVKKENNKGNIVIISTVSHKQKMREMARDQLINFMEINLICDPQICAIRDYKNIYNKIDEKSNECLPGVTESYEISDSPELLLNTADHSIEDSGNILLQNVLKIIFEIDVDITALHN
mgnify:CR=1 FL=1